MIVPSWITMRTQWSGLGTTDHDGIKTWDTSLLSLGFSGADITCTRTVGGVYTFTTVAASDWWVSQRADWFDVTEPSSTSMRMTVSTSGLAAVDGLTASELRRLWRGVWVYCRRQSDGAIGVFDCFGRGVDELSTDGSVTG